MDARNHLYLWDDRFLYVTPEIHSGLTARSTTTLLLSAVGRQAGDAGQAIERQRLDAVAQGVHHTDHAGVQRAFAASGADHGVDQVGTQPAQLRGGEVTVERGLERFAQGAEQPRVQHLDAPAADTRGHHAARG